MWRGGDMMADGLFPKMGRRLQARSRHGFVCLRHGSAYSSKAGGGIGTPRHGYVFHSRFHLCFVCIEGTSGYNHRGQWIS